MQVWGLGFRVPGAPNIAPQTIGFPYNEDPNKVPLISETRDASRVQAYADAMAASDKASQSLFFS